MLTIQEIIEHCDRQLKRGYIGSIHYEEHEAVKMYLQELLCYKNLEEQGLLVVRGYQCKHYIKNMMLRQREDGLDTPDKLDFCSYGERVGDDQ